MLKLQADRLGVGWAPSCVLTCGVLGVTSKISWHPFASSFSTKGRMCTATRTAQASSSLAPALAAAVEGRTGDPCCTVTCDCGASGLKSIQPQHAVLMHCDACDGRLGFGCTAPEADSCWGCCCDGCCSDGLLLLHTSPDADGLRRYDEYFTVCK